MSYSAGAIREQNLSAFKYSESSIGPAKEQKFTKQIPENASAVNSCYTNTRTEKKLPHSDLRNPTRIHYSTDPTSEQIAMALEPAVSKVNKSLENRTSTNFLSNFIQTIKDIFSKFFGKSEIISTQEDHKKLEQETNDIKSINYTAVSKDIIPEGTYNFAEFFYSDNKDVSTEDLIKDLQTTAKRQQNIL